MLKNILKVLTSNALLALLGLVTTFLFPALLSVEDYAYYQEFLLYISYINICHLGIASGMFLNYAGKDQRSADRAQYRSEITLICLVLLAFTGVGFIIWAATRNTLVLFTVLTIIPQCLLASFLSLYQAWNQFSRYSILNALHRLVFVAVLLVGFWRFGSVSGFQVVLVYEIILWLVFLYPFIDYTLFVRGVRPAKILSRVNLETTGNGFLIMLGNYINILFHTIDKQFVKIFYSQASFAKYSFAMTLQNVMTIFITALAQPFYPHLAKGGFEKDYIARIKELLFVFGSYSGCAYFAVAFVVRRFLPHYTDSLSVVGLFFAVFPALAVINVLYINLYRIRRMLKKYNLTLAGMVLAAFLLNCGAVLLKGDYVGISLATLIAYYVWLFWSQRDFEEIRMGWRDILYLAGFMACFFGLTRLVKSEIAGFFLYGAVITGWNLLLYRENLIEFLNRRLGKVSHGR